MAAMSTGEPMKGTGSWGRVGALGQMWVAMMTSPGRRSPAARHLHQLEGGGQGRHAAVGVGDHADGRRPRAHAAQPADDAQGRRLAAGGLAPGAGHDDAHKVGAVPGAVVSGSPSTRRTRTSASPRERSSRATASPEASGRSTRSTISRTCQEACLSFLCRRAGSRRSTCGVTNSRPSSRQIICTALRPDMAQDGTLPPGSTHCPAM